ncbi:RidA family protein [Xanthomonas nasturtii]|uniref:RidA family protein n=1 Tax=Xanthomonas nasturtii TaxID=1843581 RepID=UPI002B23D2AC|nr:RidA family protein [Xanthomonas nasturtii]MEA9578705.1 RidA family protein [Xanthomonas nasturtii]
MDMSCVVSGADRRLDALVAGEPELNPSGRYSSFFQIGDCWISSGVVGRHGGAIIAGPLRSAEDVPIGERAAAAAVLLILRAAQKALGTLDRVDRVVTLQGFISSTADFKDHVLVMDAASACLQNVLPQSPLPARTAVGVTSLPGGGAVEVVMVLATRDIAD